MGIIIFWILISLLIGKYAENRGYSFGIAFLASVLLSPLVTFVILVLMPAKESGDQIITGGMRRECPYCAEPVKIQAINCPHCGKEVPRVIVHRMPYAKPAQTSVWTIAFIIALVFGGIGFIAYEYKEQNGSDWPTAKSVPVTHQTNPVSAPAVAQDLEPEPPSNYGADWVIVDGQRIDNVTRVSPAPDNQVHIATPTMGENVLISKVPQGFLNEWHLSMIH